MATTILVSQYLGAKDYTKVSEIYTIYISTNLFLGLFSGIILFILGSYIFRLMHLPNDLSRDATIYIRIVGSGLFIQSTFFTYSVIFRSNGLMKVSMYTLFLANVFNIIGNLILLNGYLALPKMGVDGVAISTLLSRLVVLIIMMYIFNKKVNGEISLKYISILDGNVEVGEINMLYKFNIVNISNLKSGVKNILLILFFIKK